MTRTRFIRDPTGLTTGRWTVYRHVTLFTYGRPYQWVWKAEPIAVDPFAARIVANETRTFTTQRAALDYATDQAKRNLR